MQSNLLKCLLLVFALSLALSDAAHADPTVRLASQTFAYIATTGPTAGVYQYRVEASGNLTPLTPSQIHIGDAPGSLLADPKGRYLYVTGRKGDVFQYGIRSTGQLGPLKPSRVVGLSTASAHVISPDGRYLYLFEHGSRGKSPIAPFRIAGNGTLHRVNAKAVPLPETPRSVAIDPSSRFLYVLIGNDAYYYVRPYVLQYRIQPDGSLRSLQPAAIRDGLGVLVRSMAVDGRDGLIYICSRDTLSAYKIGADGQLQFASAVLSKENLPYPNDIDGGGLSRLQYDETHHEMLCGGTWGKEFESHFVIMKLGQDGALADRMDYHLSQGGRLTENAIGNSCIPSALALDEKNNRLYAYVQADDENGLQADTLFFVNIGEDGGFPPVADWCIPGTTLRDTAFDPTPEEDDWRRLLIVTQG